MRYITIPEDVKIGEDGEGQDVLQPFTTWLVNPLSGHQFLADGAAVRKAAKLELRFEGKKAGDVVPLDDAEWELLKDASENPKGGFAHPAVRLFLPFMDAVLDATEEEPAPKKAAEAA